MENTCSGRLALVCLQVMFLKIVFSLTHPDLLKYYEVVHPIHINKRLRQTRDLTTTNDNYYHFEETRFKFSGFERDFPIKLTRNDILFPNSFKVYSQSNEENAMKEIKNIAQNCFYHGEIEGKLGTMVALSTCEGLRGLIRDQDGEEFFIEPHQKNTTLHILYKMSDLSVNKTHKCGHGGHFEKNNSMYYSPAEMVGNSNGRYTRKRRSTDNSMGLKYIEIVAVVDNRKYNQWGASIEKTQLKAMEIMNFVDMVYKTMSIRTPLLALYIWDRKDEIIVTTSAQQTFNHFVQYTGNVLKSAMYFDNAQLISGVDFARGVVGHGGIGSMCTRVSCSVNQDHSSNPAISANTIAHELGHNLGFLHNTKSCNCPNSPCVMAATAPTQQAKGFSSCTKNSFETELEKGKYLCLFDYPEQIYGKSVCGDGYREGNEECDCGTIVECEKSGANKCCNHKTCKLFANVQCGDGECCEDCKFKPAGSICRDKVHPECDLPEFCTGYTNHCPRNAYIIDGKRCANSQSYCYQGLCKTHTQQCQILWGKDGYKGNDLCFRTNLRGDAYGNCGKNDKGNSLKCAKENVMCGRIHCQPKPGTSLPMFPLLGTNKAIKLLTFKIGDKTSKCKAIRMYFPKQLEDPTITQDGTKCGEDSICLDHVCTNISTNNNKKCKYQCKNGGVCNNKGNCHCPVGYACPLCDKPGPGGSIDSGQGCFTEDSKLKGDNRGYAVLVVIPMALIFVTLGYMFCQRRNPHISERIAFTTTFERGKSESKNDDRKHVKNIESSWLIPNLPVET